MVRSVSIILERYHNDITTGDDVTNRTFILVVRSARQDMSGEIRWDDAGMRTLCACEVHVTISQLRETCHPTNTRTAYIVYASREFMGMRKSITDVCKTHDAAVGCTAPFPRIRRVRWSMRW